MGMGGTRKRKGKEGGKEKEKKGGGKEGGGKEGEREKAEGKEEGGGREGMYVQCKMKKGHKCEEAHSPTSAMKEMLAECGFPGAMGSNQQHRPTSCKGQLK